MVGLGSVQCMAWGVYKCGCGWMLRAGTKQKRIGKGRVKVDHMLKVEMCLSVCVKKGEITNRPSRLSIKGMCG